MYYLIEKAVRKKIHEAGFQITKDGLASIDAKIDEYLERLAKQWNGHHKRIDANLVSLTNLK